MTHSKDRQTTTADDMGDRAKVRALTNALETPALRLTFDHAAGGLTTIANKLTGEAYAVAGDAFAVETTAFRRAQAEIRQVAWTATADTVTARYADADLTAEVAHDQR